MSCKNFAVSQFESLPLTLSGQSHGATESSRMIKHLFLDSLAMNTSFQLVHSMQKCAIVPEQGIEGAR
jgi:hypothetical protein